MTPTFPPFRRIDAIRDFLDNATREEGMEGTSRGEKQEWVRQALGHIDYESLSREERGLVRQYLRQVSGYSRAQVERHISAFRKSVPASAVAAPAIPSASVEVPSAAAVIAQPFFSWKKIVIESVVVATISGVAATSLLYGSLLPISKDVPPPSPTERVRVVVRTESGETPTWIGEPRPEVRSPILQRVNERRRERVAASVGSDQSSSSSGAGTRPAASITSEQVSSAPSSLKFDPVTRRIIPVVQDLKPSAPDIRPAGTQLLASLRISGTPLEGQIVTYHKGRAVWGNLPENLLEGSDDGRASGVGRRPPGLSTTSHGSAPDDNRGRGGGGGGGGTSGGSTSGGISQSDADARYVNVTGDDITGTLTVSSTGVFNGALTTKAALSGASLFVTNLKDCDTIDTDSAGNLVCGSDASGGSGGGTLSTSTGSLKTYFEKEFVQIDGDTMTGGLLIVNDGLGTQTIDAGLLLEIAGTASGRMLHAQDLLTTSGSLIVRSNATVRGLLSGATIHASTGLRSSGTLAIETTGVFGGALTTKAALSGASLIITNLKGCDSIDTDASGALSCGSDASGGAGTFGSGNVVTLTSRRYVDSSGDTMTGGLLIINGGSGTLPTIDAGLLLEIAGTASGRMLHAQDLLTTSGSLIVRSNGTIRGILSGATIHASTGLRSSGTLAIEGNARIDDMTFVVDATSNRVGIGTSSPENALEVVGTMSGRSLQVTGTGAAPLIFTHIATGDVGIGTATPDLLGTQATSYRLLTVYNSDKTEGSILNLANNGQGEFPGVIQFVDNSNTTGKRLGLMFSQRTGTVPNAGGDLHFGTLAQGAAGTVTRLTIKDGGNVGIGTTAPETILEIIGVGSGRILHAQDFLSTSGSLLVRSNGTIRGILSGATIHASTGLRSSGTLAIETTGVFGGALTTKATLSGTSLVITDLKNCNTIDTNSNGAFVCGTDDTSAGGGLATSTGSLQTYFGTQFVRIQGDTMTGGLLIVNDGLGTQTIDAGLLLEIAGTASGRMLHAQDLLTTSGSLIVRSNGTFRGILSGATIHTSSGLRSSGTLAIEGAARIDDTTFAVDASNNRVGILTNAPETALEVVGTMSGSDVRVAGGAFQISALGLMTLTNQVSTFDALNIKLSAEDQARFILNADGTMEWGGGSLATDTNLYRSAANILKTDDSLYISGTVSGSQVHAKDILTTSGALIVRNNATIRGILSGATIHTSTGLRSSGTLAIETTGVFGGALTTKATFSGASLVITDLKNCNTIDTNSNGAFVCGTDDTSAGGGLATSTGSLQTYFATQFVQIQGDTMTGGLLIVNDGLGTQTIDAGLLLEIAGTASGRMLHAQDLLTTSGSLIVRSNGTFRGSLSGATIHASTGLRSSGTLAIENTGVFGGALTTKAALSGASIVITNLKGCDTIDTDASGALSCGTDEGGSAGGSLNTSTGSLKTYFEKEFVQIDGDTMTGGLLIVNDGLGTQTIDAGLLLEIAGMASGRVLKAMDTLASSGSLVIHKYAGSSTGNLLVVDAKGLVYDGTNKRVGIGLSAPKTMLEVQGTVSGSNLYVTNKFMASGAAVIDGNTVVKGDLTVGTPANGVRIKNSSNNTLQLLHEDVQTDLGAFELNSVRLHTTTADNDQVTLGTTGLTGISGMELLWSSSATNNAVAADTGLNRKAAGILKVSDGSTGFGSIWASTASGLQVHATQQLRSSGSLSVAGAVLLKGSSITLSDSSFATCTALETVNGVLTCGTDDTGSAGGSLNTSTGSLKTYFEKEFVQIDGDTMTGGLLIVNDGLGTQTIDAGLLLEIAGTASGRVIKAMDTLASSGSLVIHKYAGSSTGNLLVVDAKGLVYDGTNKRVGIGLSAPKTQLEVQRTMSGNALYVSRALSGAGLSGCWGTANKLVWSGSTQRFGCQSDQGGGGITVKEKTSPETVNNSATLQNDDQLNFAIGASETWVYIIEARGNNASGMGGYQVAVTAPSNARCMASLRGLGGLSTSLDVSRTCGASIVPASQPFSSEFTARISGVVRNSTNAGTVQLQWAQDAADPSDLTLYSGSTLLAFKTVGSDLAEIYASRESLIPGTVVTLDPALPAGVQRSTKPYDMHLMGVVSTQPGLIIGEPIGEGDMVFLALAGRIPVLVSTENGAIQPGDYLTSSSQEGIAMRATKPGMVVGQAMEGYDEEGIGVVMTFVKNTHMGGFDGTETFATGSGDTLSSGGPLTVTGSLLVEGAMDTLSISEGIAEEVQRQLAESTANLESRMLRLESQLTVLSGSVVNQVFLLANEIDSRLQMSDLSLSGSLRARDIAARSLSLDDTLAVKDASVLGDLTVGGVLSVDDFYLPNGGKIDGALRVSSLEVQSDMVIDGALTLNGTLNLMKGITFGSGTTMTFHDLVVQNALRVIGPVTIEGLATFLAEVNIKGQLTLSNRQAGFAEIPQSGSSVTIRFDPPLLAEPVVTVTPSGRVGMEWWTEASSATGFTISLMELARWPLRFNWTALAVENPKAAAGASSADLSSVSSESSSSASSEQSSSSALPEGTPPASIPFPVDANGVPISTNLAWNSCIRRQPLITSDGSPINCWRYRDGYVWDHPDLLIQFTYNTSVSPAILLLPEGYVVEEIKEIEEINPSTTLGTGKIEDVSSTPAENSESTSSSSEQSSAVSSISSVSTSSESSVSEASSSASSENSASSQSSEASSASASSESGEASSESASSEGAPSESASSEPAETESVPEPAPIEPAVPAESEEASITE